MAGRVYSSQFRTDRGRGRELDALFDEIFTPSEVEESTSFVAPVWAPRVDVSASDTDYLITMDVPGIRPEDITMKVQGRRLTICGARRDAADPGRTYLRVERRRGDFCRVLTLPPDARLDAIDMACRDGVLTLTVPKA